MNQLTLNTLPTPVLLVWGGTWSEMAQLCDSPEKIVSYLKSGDSEWVSLKGNWQLLEKLEQLTDTEILRSIADKGYYFTNPVPEPEYIDGGPDGGGYDDKWIKEYEEAQSKTLPANTLIFKRV